ncbi:hypothetical protein DFQ04_0060 [Algoriphagus boseongensis]|uniref:Outer membrane lipoprotein-sorting protein n=1 Tax=Algoriphagus boseongensis TaxID=1442587 RepID=A0A4R6T8W2_9BACT|nr:DUF6503 family protein [Algoriphagus boseongensis]TDQ18262.1 hypothetical protein DFQ04_0060 [Algoriphagus boseongensis]
MKFTQSLLAILLIFAFSCKQEPSTPNPRLEQPEEFKKLLDAHGDWKQWIDAKSFSFNMVHETNLAWENHYIDLVGRKVRIDGDTWQIGNDGQNVWISPNRQAFQGQSVRFYHNLYFYFYSIPYIFTDPGVIVKKTDPKLLNGVSYEAFEVSFEPGTGDSSKDKYFMLVDPESGRLAWLLYYVTFFDQNNTKLNALKYDDYRDADGLVFPRILTGYELVNDSTKNIRYQVSFTGPLLVNEALDDKLFKMPENNAVVAN